MTNYPFSKNGGTVLPESFKPNSDNLKFGKIDGYNRHRREKIMTYVLGAKCKDGIVLIGDRKVTNSKTYVDKIRLLPDRKRIHFAAAGSEYVFEEFLNELPRRVTLESRRLGFVVNKGIPIEKHYRYNIYNFKQDCVKLIKEMKNTYSEVRNPQSTLQVLFVAPLYGKDKKIIEKLFYMDMNECCPYPAESFEKPIFAIGYDSYGKEFLKLWNPDWTMEETAKLGYFIIKYLENTNPDAEGSVGVGDGYPQVIFFYENDVIEQLTVDKMKKLFDETDKKIKQYSDYINSGKFLRS